MPGHYQDPTIYDLIASQQMSETSITQLNNATKNTFIENKNIEFWSGVITVARALEESRTYAHGLPIPEASACETVTVADSASGTFKPTGTEVWLIQGIDEDNCGVFLFDGTTAIDISSSAGYVARTRNPIYITSTCYLLFNNASGGEQTPGIAYHKVSL